MNNIIISADEEKKYVRFNFNEGQGRQIRLSIVKSFLLIQLSRNGYQFVSIYFSNLIFGALNGTLLKFVCLFQLKRNYSSSKCKLPSGEE